MSSPEYRYLMPEQLEVGQDDLSRATRLLRAQAGIILGAHKNEMAARTLSNRTREAGLPSVADYLFALEQNPRSPEWEPFINAFTINHTAFFREQHHFALLSSFVKTRKTPVSVWTCAASTGEEAYSIAITLHEAIPQASTRASVLATDIDTQALKRARAGVYSLERVQPVPQTQLKKYFYRGTGSNAGLVRVKSCLHDLVSFDHLNLVAPAWPIDQKFDAIFCRNTMIYFDKQTQSRILERFAPMLKEGGLLFAGHSENFTYLTKAFRLRGQTVYAVA